MRSYPANFACEYCGKKYDKFKKGLCQPCYNRKLRKGRLEHDIAPKGAGTTDKRGYRIVHVNGEQEYEHRIVAKAQIGEVVHHRNENKSDNDPDNLRKFESQSEHMKEHARMRKEKANG